MSDELVEWVASKVANRAFVGKDVYPVPVRDVDRWTARAILRQVADAVEERYGKVYSTEFFPEIKSEEWARINDLLKSELGFPLDRVTASNCRMRVKHTVRYLREQAAEEGASGE